ncbi:2-amino-4-hydroxy-6-hydroxymethyldihydropteridine diphosphokinase [Odoribacter sp. OttesenSCG-928-G04]|nr:2-amino-4-hydroxy-6-hydroxymethyldihydropteridine diphosphokinase [Odoribacter sp. OttesenSCG-928-G04]
MSSVTLILGSNSVYKKEIFQTALNRLGQSVGEITTLSALYETEPWGLESDELFLNQVVILKTSLSPETCLSICLSIEDELGRVRIPGVRYSSRTIDIDILFYDQQVIHTETLTIPHPRISERNFVLAPLNELLPDFMHPTLKKTIGELYKDSPDPLKISKLS